MNTYFYSESDEQVIKRMDKKFDVVVRIGRPEDGHSDSHDLVIFDSRNKDDIATSINRIYNRENHIA